MPAMPKFRKKPLEIEAVQFDGHPSNDPPGVFRRPEDNTPYVVTIHDQRCYLAPGDWIVPEPDGVHYYPIKADIFARSYESADHVVPEENGRAAYERYLYSSDGKSLVSGAELPGFDGLPEGIKKAWIASADPGAPRMTR